MSVQARHQPSDKHWPLCKMIVFIVHQLYKILVRGMIKMFSAPCFSGHQGMKILHYFSIKSPFMAMHYANLFRLAFPFKIEGLFLVPQALLYFLYDAFIASLLRTTKMICTRQSYIALIFLLV